MTETEAVEQLVELQALRNATIRQQRRVNSAACAMVARMQGYQVTLPEKDRKKRWAEAERLVKAIEAKEDIDGLSVGVVDFVRSSLDARQLFDVRRKENEALMRDIAQTGLGKLEGFINHAPGFGWLGLAIIAGELGKPLRLSTVSGAWKRLGLAAPDCYAAVAEDGTKYKAIPRRRRSAIWTIGDSLIKGNKLNGDDGYYRKLYLDHKIAQVERVKTKMHAHRRAQRYMEKRLIRELWKAWRDAYGKGNDNGQSTTKANSRSKQGTGHRRGSDKNREKAAKQPALTSS